MSNPETSNPELHSSCSSPNQDKPNWLTHSKSISAQKIPTQSTLKPLGNQNHKSRKIYKSVHIYIYIYKGRRILRPEVLHRLNLSFVELPGWAAGADLVGHWRSWHGLLVSLWAPTPNGEEGWDCVLSGRECRVKRERGSLRLVVESIRWRDFF